MQRKDGSVVRFDDNACVLIGKGGDPIGSRLNGEFIQCWQKWIREGRDDVTGGIGEIAN